MFGLLIVFIFEMWENFMQPSVPLGNI